jgi:LacI family transcriptional regulator
MSSARQKLTSRDLARLAGVSQATVSRVLTNHPRVSEVTRARVLKVLEEENFIPNSLARAMKTGRTETIGVFMSRITSPFHAALLDAIGRKLASRELQMIVWDLEHHPQEMATQVMRRRLVDGSIFTSAAFDSRPDKVAVDSGVPTVLVHRGLDDLRCDQVVGDNRRGARELGDYLIRCGHTRIGLITSPLTVSTGRDREHGFRDALKAAGIRLPAAYVVRGSYDHQDGHAAVRKLMALKTPPTAVFCITDILALGAVDGARSLGLRIPDDLSIAGFDNVAMASWESYDLTTVDQPTEAIVDAGVQLLIQRIHDPSREPTVTTLPCQLIIRGSTGPPSKHAS